MKSTYYIFFLFFLLACSSETPHQKGDGPDNDIQEESMEAPVQVENFNLDFEGTIGNQYAIVMNLRTFEENIAGSYYYTQHNKEIRLEGMFNYDDNSFVIDEFQTDGEKTGTFTGNLNNDYSLEGLWTAFSKAPGREEPLLFQAKKTKESFVWFRENLPFHPCQIEQLRNMEGTLQTIDISKPLNFPENYEMYDSQKLQNGYTIDYDDEYMMRTPYFEYNYLGKKDDLFIVSISESGGGTGDFSNIKILSLDGNLLKEMKTLTAGDRCNGGVDGGRYNNGIISYSKYITPTDLYLLANDSIEKPHLSLDDCAVCCVGTAYYEYTIESESTTLISVVVTVPDITLHPENASDVDYFNFILSKYGEHLNQKQIDLFVEELINTIVNE